MLLSIFYYFPHLVREDITSLVEFFFGLAILTKVWIVIAELVEIFNKLVKKLLLLVSSLQEGKELFLNNCLSSKRLFPLLANTPENVFHLASIV